MNAIDRVKALRQADIKYAADNFDDDMRYLLRTIQDFPKWALMLAYNWDLLSGLRPPEAKGLAGLRGYTFSSMPRQAIIDFTHFLSHEVFDDGSPSIVWVTSPPLDRSLFPTVQEFWAWRKEQPWTIVPVGTEGAKPILTSNLLDWSMETQEGPVVWPPYQSVGGMKLEMEGVWLSDVVSEPLCTALLHVQARRVGPQEPSEAQRFLISLVDPVAGD